MTGSTAADPDHYRDAYWNDLPAVLAYLCRRATGDPDLWWMDYFKQKYAATPFEHGLVIACGNGWVERSLIDRGVARRFDAFDPSERYLREAEAERGSREIHYFRDGFETFRPARRYDLIVNVAALHHAQYLHRHLRRLAASLRPGGRFVHWEYVGPSRNQYPDAQVELMTRTNAKLAPRFRTPHGLRPGLRGAIRGDVTEAVHSAEIVRAVEAYFEMLEFKPLGGGVAYQILWNNVAEFARGDADATAALEELIRIDDDATRRGAVPNLFAFFVCGPRANAGLRVAIWRLTWRALIEPSREAWARLTSGFYPSEILIWLGRFARRKLRALRRTPGESTE